METQRRDFIKGAAWMGAAAIAAGCTTAGGAKIGGVGSMSANSDPSRVFKNKKMPGQWGGERVTIQNLEIVKVDEERNLLMIKGAIPGANGSLVTIRDAVKA